METTRYIWMNGTLVAWSEAKIHVLTHSLHYGSAVFEGIRFYETKNGPAIFRLDDHLDRLFFSAGILEMKIPYDKTVLRDACIETVTKNNIPSGYIRPIAYFGYGKMGLDPDGAPVEVSIACWPWGKYLGPTAVTTMVSRYMRIHPDSSEMGAKISGHYANSIVATREAKRAGYQEAVLLDHRGNVAEGPGENIFMVKDGVIITPKADSILPGITRDSIIEIAEDMKMKVEERDISLDEFKHADECFFTGTAAEVTAIAKVDDVTISEGMGPITKKLQEVFLQTVAGEVPQYSKWLTPTR